MNILDKILEHKKEEVKILKHKFTLNSFESMEFFQGNKFSLINNVCCTNDISIIAEIKKQSPSKGIINKEFDLDNIIEIYFNSEIEGISILTDESFFGGSIINLEKIAKIKKLPLLRKDFIIDEYQVYQSKAYGADVILLICEALSENQIKDLTVAAIDIGLEVLLELHSEAQLNKIDFNINKLIGINNRNLENFSVDLNNTKNISQLLPKDITIISESGFNKKEDIEKIKNMDIKAVLVGEYLMSSNDLKYDLKKLKEWCRIEN